MGRHTCTRVDYPTDRLTVSTTTRIIPTESTQHCDTCSSAYWTNQQTSPSSHRTNHHRVALYTTRNQPRPHSPFSETGLDATEEEEEYSR